MSKLASRIFIAAVVASCTICLSSFSRCVADEAASETIEMAGGKVVAQKPAEWKSVPPKNNMVQLEYAAPADSETPARITVSQATGSIEQNVARWISQFDGASKDDATIEEKEVDGCKVHKVDITGTFLQKSGGPFAPGPAEKMADYRMIGVIIDSETVGKIFIKITGPKDIVEKLNEGVDKMIASIDVK
jgi:hypothetical protein